MVREFRDLTGETLGCFTVLGRAYFKYEKRWKFKCLCKCNNVSFRNLDSLLALPKYCRKCSKIDGQCPSNLPLYGLRRSMLRRCYDPGLKAYKYYGGRGITVCDAWRNDFRSFYDWATSNGYERGLTIERIDVNGNYCPENCTWITNEKQQINKTNTRFVTVFGETLPLPIAARKYSTVSCNTVEKRLLCGWSDDHAVLLPSLSMTKWKYSLVIPCINDLPGSYSQSMTNPSKPHRPYKKRAE